MENYKEFYHPEMEPKIFSEPPVIESFLDPARAAEIWPENIAKNKIFLEQIEKRKELNDRFDNITKCLTRPDIPLEDAIKQGHITEQQVTELYDSLSKLLESDQDYNRLILYLPFEFLPNAAWHPTEKNLERVMSRFKVAYMEAWKSLLAVYDVRANFVDGDVLEADHRDGDHPRIVKAAHLIPKLVEKGFLEIADVLALMEKSDDEILKNSIADTLPVLADLGLLNEKEIKAMEKSSDGLARNMAKIIVATTQSGKENVKRPTKIITFLDIQRELGENFSQIEAMDYGNITEKRRSWMQQEHRQKAVESLGKDISSAIVSNQLIDEALENFLSSEASSASQQALVEGIRETIESFALAEPNKAQELYAQHKETLLTLWKNNDPEVKGTLLKTFRRFRYLNIVDNAQLSELKITLPRLAGPFSENLKLMNNELREVQKMAALIESDPELSNLLYPIVLIYGSRLKGYGEVNADIDLAVFVKSGTSPDDRKKLHKMLMKKMPVEKIHPGDIIEFWLEEKEGRLEIITPAENDLSLGESYSTHILFGAAWEGNKSAMRELREKLLVSYLYDTKEIIKGRAARDLYLEELERDTLQYRLMHKGYEKIFPPCGGIHTLHADEIDGNSIFWDSGYRQLATKLFLSRVFLPKIPASQK